MIVKVVVMVVGILLRLKGILTLAPPLSGTRLSNSALAPPTLRAAETVSPGTPASELSVDTMMAPSVSSKYGRLPTTAENRAKNSRHGLPAQPPP